MNDGSYKLARAEREWQDRHESLLQVATDLFMEHGFNGTTMQMVADKAGFSVGYLYKHFGGKQTVLDEILSRHLRLYDGIRHDFRADTGRSPLDRYRAEIAAVSRHLAGYPGLLPVMLQPRPDQPGWQHAELDRHRREDIELVREAQAAGELPAGDPALLAAALSGAVWSLLETLILLKRLDEVGRIPEFVERYVLAPMTRSTLPESGKESFTS